ncbi:MAG TPA: hypothetical protein VLH09_02945 [Bryobacteraceae bacterium]|nr:hypothetical protein [Bryobacteraceae bacterium]
MFNSPEIEKDGRVTLATAGRANDILDNLIAEKKTRPMIVVMPAGWTPPRIPLPPS